MDGMVVEVVILMAVTHRIHSTKAGVPAASSPQPLLTTVGIASRTTEQCRKEKRMSLCKDDFSLSFSYNNRNKYTQNITELFNDTVLTIGA